VSLLLAPATIAVRYAVEPGEVTLFVLSALALVPLAWLIGEATEHAAEHTGHGIGGFLNATFGNGPELIIALFAIGQNLPQVVRGSLAGSVVSNLLLVYGFTQLAGPDRARLDRRSLLMQVGLVALAVVGFAVPVALGNSGDPDRHSLVLTSIPFAALLLLAYLGVVGKNLREHRQRARDAAAEGSWTLPRALLWLGLATAATVWVSEILVGSIDAFGHAVGLSEFFLAIVVVAVVGNAAEHASSVVIARNGKMALATEIPISSSAQVGLLVIPVVMLVSLVFAHPLSLAFRWQELVAMGGATALVGAMVADGRSRRWEGAVLVLAFVGAAVGFAIAGNR
jgi:Ca2+:H+ antiporter